MVKSYRFSAEERDSYARDGYVLRAGAFSARECGDIALAVENLVGDLVAAKRAEKQVVGSYMFELQSELRSVVKWEPQNPEVVQGVEPFAHISEQLNRWAHDPRLVDPSKDVVGDEDIALFTEKITMKRARTGGSIVLHQDYPYWMRMTEIADRIMTALIYLDDATVENGCLEVVPGSHKHGLQSRKKIEGFGSLEMDDAIYDTNRLIPIEAKTGSIVFFGGFLVHRSLPNRSNADRRALLYSYQPGGHPHGLELNRLLAEKQKARASAIAET